MRAILLASSLALFVLLTLAPLTGHAQSPDSHPLANDALMPPPPGAGILAAASESCGLSQYMAGSVAVRLVLPESSGAIDRSSADWTAAQIAAIRSHVQAGLDWWVARLPLARLSFQLQVEVVPTDYEPIAYGLSEEGRWIGDTLARLGFTGATYFDQAYAAANALRAERGTDWATTIFVVNSAGQASGAFADGRFAYAYIGGPFMVLTADAGAYGSSRIATVVAHELGHIFGALDQYAAAGIRCDQRSGYLDTPTSNSQFEGCGTSFPSIMLEPLGAFAAGQVDASALHQLGYRDSDADGLIDPLDTMPTLELQDHSLASSTGRPLIRGIARDVAFPSASLPAVSLNPIRAVEYRVDGGPWMTASPTDGAFDGVREPFSAELPLYDGSYLLEVRAINSIGVSSPPLASRIEVAWVGPSPAYTVTAPAVTASRSLELELDGPAATAALQISASPDFADASWQPFAPRLSYQLAGADGPRTIYVRFRDQFALVSLPFRVTTVLDTTPPHGRAVRLPADPSLLRLEAYDAATEVVAVELAPANRPAEWHPFAPEIRIMGVPATPITVRFRDAAGNVSPAYQATLGYRTGLPIVRR